MRRMLKMIHTEAMVKLHNKRTCSCHVCLGTEMCEPRTVRCLQEKISSMKKSHGCVIPVCAMSKSMDVNDSLYQILASLCSVGIYGNVHLYFISGFHA